MSTKIETLVDDIYSLFDPTIDHECDEARLNEAAEQFKELFRSALKAQDPRGKLRFSGLGKPDCEVWWKINRPEAAQPMPPKAYVKFLYGHLLELMLLFLAKEAGHEVEDEQKEVEVDGVKGHMDAKIDGVTVDVKSASSYSFQKFVQGRLAQDDPFGYIAQLSGYCHTNETPRGAFLVIDKTLGDIALVDLDPEHIEANHPSTHIARQKGVIANPNPPRCYDPVPDGKSGNEKLPTKCSYCDFSKSCWADANDGQGLRTFIYSNGPRYLTKVVREPDVYEVFD